MSDFNDPRVSKLDDLVNRSLQVVWFFNRKIWLVTENVLIMFQVRNWDRRRFQYTNFIKTITKDFFFDYRLFTLKSH